MRGPPARWYGHSQLLLPQACGQAVFTQGARREAARSDRGNGCPRRWGRGGARRHDEERGVTAASGRMEGPRQGTASAAARPLLKWRYASTLTEACLRFKSGVPRGAHPGERDRRGPAPSPRRRATQLRRAAARRPRGLRRAWRRRLTRRHRAPRRRRHRHAVPQLPFPHRTLRSRLRGRGRRTVPGRRRSRRRAPWQALTTWLRRFVDYMATKRAIREAMDTQSAVFTSCRASMYEAGAPSSPAPRQPARSAPT